MQRNWRCRFYSTCLDRAARANSDLDCTDCTRQHDNRLQILETDLPGCLTLMVCIFSPNEKPNVTGMLETIRGSLPQHLSLIAGDRPAPWESEYSIGDLFGR
jgi:hypothetical protein